MSIADTMKGLIFKKKAELNGDPLDPRNAGATMVRGRREGEVENPYLAARRTWNDHVGSIVSQRQTWQVIGILSLLIALAGVGGVIHIGSQSKFIPYVVEVDKLGQMVAAGPVTAAAKADPRVVHASVAEFIGDARIVTPDVALQRKAVFRVYAKLSPNDPATAKMNEWLNGHPEASPFKRAEKEMVNVEIKTVLQQSPDTWQVDWVETSRDRQGIVKGQPVTMRALVTVYTAEVSSQTTDEQLRNNPMSVFVRDFSWSRIL
ncbi:TrbF protein of DNA transfer system (plasmid) [Aromatoleum aromaticum EbN1]|uniref:TrbF protein of DNA transfer system n=1 Tax=Aromatoleum aromaticum (strain DSM 19018 / LMG 30748 / EbN1) TaxID=76114 RepID=Q5NWM2_AROAE|nr:conjugal transfer protein TrbF [Aromatoleum aromaticum]CAI10542.1 TrbF protein of DNA transfer system [Aromatoleum aromaticum EbN1]